MYAASAATLGAARWGTAIGKAVQKSSVAGKNSKLLGRGGNKKLAGGGGGKLNRNNSLRLGWTWKGSAKKGNNMLSIRVGSKKSLIHFHYHILKGSN